MRAVEFVLLAGVTPWLAAQAHLPVPDDDALAAAHATFLDVLADMAIAPAGECGAIEALRRRVYDASLSPSVRFLLGEHAERCARAARDVRAGLDVADALAASFDVERTACRAACLRRFEASAAVPPQMLVGAHLDEAERLLEAEAHDVQVHLEAASRLAAVDQPPGLAAVTDRLAESIRRKRAAFDAWQAAPADGSLRARYEGVYRGRWVAGLQAMRGQGGRDARIAASKLRATNGAQLDHLAMVRSAEEWMSQSAHEADAVARRGLLRRAMNLLALASRPPLPEVLAGPEGERTAALLVRVTEGLAELATPGVDTVRFAPARGSEQLLITGGEWQVENDLLLGRNTGAATRATTRFAWKTIDSVTIRGGIRSADGLNFRVAVGSVNALLNWEVADENHVYFGEAGVRTGPRRLIAGREHTIVLRQVADQVVVFVDGEQLATGAATLAGTVSVYPAVGSQIFVRSLDVVGDLDLSVTVTGPSHETR